MIARTKVKYDTDPWRLIINFCLWISTYQNAFFILTSMCLLKLKSLLELCQGICCCLRFLGLFHVECIVRRLGLSFKHWTSDMVGITLAWSWYMKWGTITMISTMAFCVVCMVMRCMLHFTLLIRVRQLPFWHVSSLSKIYIKINGWVFIDQ